MILRGEDGKYQCIQCGKSNPDKSKIKRHAEIHLNMSHPCIVCEKVFKTRNVLATHYSREHPNQVASPWTMQWTIPDTCILDLGAVIETMIARGPDGKYECTTCGKSFGTRQKVEYHAEVHLNLSHPCIHCQKMFKTRNSLATHYTRIHGGQHGGQVTSPWTMK